MHVSDLIRAGGSLEDAAYTGQAELTRYAVVDGNVRRTELITVDLAAIRRGDPAANVELRPYDALVIKPIPMWMEPGVIEVAGEVRFPGKYPIHQGETLHSVLVRAGGFDDVAFPEGAVFTREELRKREKDQLDMYSNRLQSDLAALSLQVVAGSAILSNGGGGASASQGLLIGQQLLWQLRQTKPVGRLVINVRGCLQGTCWWPLRRSIEGRRQAGGSEAYAGRHGPGRGAIVPLRMSSQRVSRGTITSRRAAESRSTRIESASTWCAQTGTSCRALGRAGSDAPRVPICVPEIPSSCPWTRRRFRCCRLVAAITTIIYNLAIGYILVHQDL